MRKFMTAVTYAGTFVVVAFGEFCLLMALANSPLGQGLDEKWPGATPILLTAGWLVAFLLPIFPARFVWKRHGIMGVGLGQLAMKVLIAAVTYVAAYLAVGFVGLPLLGALPIPPLVRLLVVLILPILPAALVWKCFGGVGVSRDDSKLLPTPSAGEPKE